MTSGDVKFRFLVCGDVFLRIGHGAVKNPKAWFVESFLLRFFGVVIFEIS